MKVSKIALSAVASFCVATTVSAIEFQVLGSKAASMGGAGIATSPASLASYNNPALLGHNKGTFSAHVGGGFGIKDTGAFAAAGDLSDLNFQEVMDNVNAKNPTTSDVETLKKARDIIVGMDKTGFQLNPTVDVALAYKSYGLGVYMTSDIGGVANIDQTRTALIIYDEGDDEYYDIETGLQKTKAEYEASSLQYAVENKNTNVDVLGLALVEVPLAYGHQMDTAYGSLAIGGALKLMAGTTFYQRVDIDSDDAMDDMDKNTQNTSTFGIDLGLAFKPTEVENLTLALVGKNLNSPAFDIAAVAGGGEFKLDPMFRAGMAYKPNNWVELALDADLTENKSVTQYNTQYIGGGLNFDLSVLELNVGLMKNIADNDKAGVVYTAGIATGPSWLHLEISGQMASKTGEIEGTSYPKQATVNFALSSSW